MTSIIALIGSIPAVRGDWWRLADNWTPRSDYTLQSVAPESVTCKTCWDWHVCAECLGAYPLSCPACDGTGRCHCQDDQEAA